MLEYILYLIKRGKIFLIPLFLAIALFGILLVFAKGSAVAPFIYTLF